MSNNYRSTLFLPQTSFGIRAESVKKEPAMLKSWDAQSLNQEFDSTASNCFLIHDGPPYANGNLHMGHALNKLLKDIINRMRLVNGQKVQYIPGWDCHGLPIEWEVEKQWIKQKKDKNQTALFRSACRQTAQDWVNIQSEQFQRLGIGGRWDNPYLTMSPKAEASIAESLVEFFQKGLIYRKTRPVMWSVVEKTALAEAEVEYKEKSSWAIYADFEITKAPQSLKGAKALIWTTTPWTIPANCAVAVGKELEYSLVTLKNDERLLLATELIPALKEKLSLQVAKTKPLGKGIELTNITLAHPIYRNETPLLNADFVDSKSGTGLVHIAPDHGVDDFYLCQANDIPSKNAVELTGTYNKELPLFGGIHIFKADEEIISALEAKNALRHKEQFSHSYPHSWRSGKPLIYLATEQWFMDLSKSGILAQALSAIEDVTWYPPAAKQRMKAMLQDRPDWCLSRQRSWGVPLPFFIHKKSGKILEDKKVFDATIKIFQAEGCDAWWNRPVEDFLGEYEPSQYTQIRDVADVWLDSGLTHRFVLDRTADLYLEGTDQHRGWFQSSLLASIATTKKPPYKAVLTHGFVLDEQGNKMSKSKGNILAPKQIIEQIGADPLRLWVALADYRGDLRLGKHILTENVELYRRIRNTLRFLLGNLAHFNKGITLPSGMPLMERWVLHRLAELERQFQQAVSKILFHNFYRSLHDFCNGDLSAFYFETLKDTLYCDGAHSENRLAAAAVLERVFMALIRWFAPVLVFTTDEAFQAYNQADKQPDNTADNQTNTKSIHKTSLPPPNPIWSKPSLDEEIEQVKKVRAAIFGEIQKQKQAYPSNLQARVILGVPQETQAILEKANMAKIALVSEVEFKTSDKMNVTIEPAKGKKCPRCWQYRVEVKNEETLCNRCQQAVADK